VGQRREGSRLDPPYKAEAAMYRIRREPDHNPYFARPYRHERRNRHVRLARDLPAKIFFQIFYLSIQTRVAPRKSEKNAVGALTKFKSCGILIRKGIVCLKSPMSLAARDRFFEGHPFLVEDRSPSG
jgi:hypothetical protein